MAEPPTEPETTAPAEDAPPPAKKKHGLFGRLLKWAGIALLVLILLLAGGLWWFNSTGLHWAAKKYADKGLELAGLEGTFKLSEDSSLKNGVKLEEIKLDSKDGGMHIEAESIEARWDWRTAAGRAVKKDWLGTTKGLEKLEVNKLRMTLKPGDPALRKDKKDKKPFGEAELAKVIRQVTEIAPDVPVAINDADVTQLDEAGNTLWKLKGFNLTRAPNRDWNISIAAVELPTMPIPIFQKFTDLKLAGKWEKDGFRLEGLQPIPGVSLEYATINTANEEVTIKAAAKIDGLRTEFELRHMQDYVIRIDNDKSSLTEATDLAKWRERFPNIPKELESQVRGLRAELSGNLKTPLLTNGWIEADLGPTSWKGLGVDSAAFRLEKTEQQWKLSRFEAAGADGFKLTANAESDPSKPLSDKPADWWRDARGNVKLEAPKAKPLAERIMQTFNIKVPPEQLPELGLNLDGSFNLKDGVPQMLALDGSLKDIKWKGETLDNLAFKLRKADAKSPLLADLSMAGANGLALTGKFESAAQGSPADWWRTMKGSFHFALPEARPWTERFFALTGMRRPIDPLPEFGMAIDAEYELLDGVPQVLSLDAGLNNIKWKGQAMENLALKLRKPDVNSPLVAGLTLESVGVEPLGDSGKVGLAIPESPKGLTPTRNGGIKLNISAQTASDVAQTSKPADWWRDLRGKVNVDLPQARPFAERVFQIIDKPVPMSPLPDLRLTSNGDYALKDGKPEQLSLDAALNSIRWKGAAVDNVTVKLRQADLSSPLLADGSVTIRPGVKPLLGLSGSYDLQKGNYAGKVKVEENKLETLSAMLQKAGIKVPNMAGRLLANWEGEGNLPQKLHKGALHVEELQGNFAGAPLLSTSLDLAYAPGRVDVSNWKLRGNGLQAQLAAGWDGKVLRVPTLVLDTARGESLVRGAVEFPLTMEAMKDGAKGILAQTAPMSVRLDAKSVPLGRIAAFLPKPLPQLPTGTISAQVALAGSPAVPTVTADVTTKGLKHPMMEKLGFPVTDAAVSVRGAGNQLKLTGNVTNAGLAPLNFSLATGYYPRAWALGQRSFKTEPITGSVDMQGLALDKLRRFAPVIKGLDGTAAANVKIAGTLGKPDLQGTIAVNGKNLVLDKVPLPTIETAQIRLTLRGREALLAGTEFRAAGGVLSIGGKITLDADNQPIFDVALTGKSLLAHRDDFANVRINGNLRLRGPLIGATLSGDTAMVESLFYKEIEILPVGLPAESTVAPALPEFGAPEAARKTLPIPDPVGSWKLDTTLRTEDPFIIRGNLARGDIVGLIRATGTLREPILEGKVEIKDAVATLPFSKLEMKSGLILFKPEWGLDPRLELRATSRVSATDVFIYVSGPASKPETLLSSSAPLPQSEIALLLATGSTSAELTNANTAATKALILLVRQLQQSKWLGSKKGLPKRLLGVLDKVDLSIGGTDPLAGRSFTSTSIKLNDRVFFTAGVDQQGNSRGIISYVFRLK